MHALQYPPDVKSVCGVVRDVSIPVESSDLAELLRLKVRLNVPISALNGPSACAPSKSFAPICDVLNCLVDPSVCPLAHVSKVKERPPVPSAVAPTRPKSSHPMLSRSQASRGRRGKRGGRR